MADQTRLEYLYEAYLDNTASPEEISEFFDCLSRLDENDPLRAIIYNEFNRDAPAYKPLPAEKWSASLKQILRAGTPLPVTPVVARKHSSSAWRYAAAAVLLAIAVVSVLYLSNKNANTGLTASVQTIAGHQNDLKPGRTGAVLILADGSQISLDSAESGLLALQPGTRIVNNNGVLKYENADAAGLETVYNTITTPKGRQFSLSLADGSRVWLNAASSIKYPASFTGQDREVEVTGEAYFEIASQYRRDGRGNQAKVPFIVHFSTPAGKKASLHVLGTHFNLNTYGDNREVKATLLEGGIKMVTDNDTEITLRPGEQANINSSGNMSVVADADLETVMAWKNGFFSFNHTDMITLMNEIGRWYDVDIEYAGAVPDRKFGGEISRNNNASQVLKIMEESDVHFRIEGKKIIVLP